MTRIFARCPNGRRIHEATPGGHWKNTLGSWPIGCPPSSRAALTLRPEGSTRFAPKRTLIEGAYERGEVVAVYLLHNHPKSGSTYEPACKRLLPLDLARQQQLAAMPWPTKTLPKVIEGAKSPLGAFIRGYLFVLLFQACAESFASENASRLAAMLRAEKNIDEILETLNGKLHRIRQESIDEELFDVISGHETLTAGRHPA